MARGAPLGRAEPLARWLARMRASRELAAADAGFFMSRVTGHAGWCRFWVFVLLGALAAAAQAQESGHALMRYPTLHGQTVVFVAHDNLWSVPRSGGVASRLTTDPGRDVLPRFSPDGKWIAFTGDSRPL
jgi:tricorn protease-like protein